jgi:hypothetical protein
VKAKTPKRSINKGFVSFACSYPSFLIKSHKIALFNKKVRAKICSFLNAI